MPADLARKLPRYDAIPAVRIGQLARDERVRGQGVGELLLADAVRRMLGAAAVGRGVRDRRRHQGRYCHCVLSPVWLSAVPPPPEAVVPADLERARGAGSD
jgi:hypothetical protein